MNEKEIDTHGLTVEQAEEIFHKVLDETRVKKSKKTVLFITGIGKIQGRFMDLCKKCDLHFSIPMANRGTIEVFFE